MKIIHKSILKELIVAFLLSLASLNFVLMTEKLLRLTRFLSGVGTSMIDMVKLIMCIQPQLFLLTIPMALLLSTLLVYGRLNIDNELVIIKISGMDFKGISFPVVILGLFCFFLNIAVSFYIGPKSSIRLREEITNIIKMRTPLAIEEGSFNTSFKDIVIFVREKPSDNAIGEIFIYDNRNKDEPRVLVAKEGKIIPQEGFAVSFLLNDGSINIVKEGKITELFFEKYHMVLKFESETASKKNAELTPYELMQQMNKANRRQSSSLYLELYRRFSLPLLCIILIFFGPPLAMLSGKSGKLGGLTLGLAVFTAYYMILVYGENIVRTGRVPPAVGAWASTAVLGIVALLLFRKESSR